MRRWFALLLALLVLLPSAASSTGSLTIPHTIFTQAGGTNVAPLLDQNYAAIAAYINAREVTLGLLSARPIAGTAGRYFLATDQNGGTFYVDTGASWAQIAAPVSAGLAQQKTGLTLANNGTATATFTIAVGAATSDDAVTGSRILMALTGGLTKSLAAWTVGTNQGCLDTGAVATFTWYSVFLIQRLDTGVVDILCSVSATAPTMPTNYTKKRRIGSIRTDWSGTGSIYFFSQTGNRFRWATSNLDISNATPGTNANTATVATPNGVQTVAVLNAASVGLHLYISELAVSDQAPSATAAPLGSVGSNDATGGTNSSQVQVVTDTAQQIRYRASANAAIRIVTIGWIELDP